MAKRSRKESFARFEIGMGTLVLIYATLSPMIGRFFPVLEPDKLYGLWPVVLLMLGPLLVLGGASLLQSWRWPLVAHLPILAWVIAVWYAFSS